MFEYFQRGAVLYWNEDPDIVERAHARAVTLAEQGLWPFPSSVRVANVHPTRIGRAWRLNGEEDMG